MASVDNGNPKEEVEECTGAKVKGHVPLDFSTSQRTLPSNENPQRKPPSSLAAIQKRMNFLKFRSPSARFIMIAQERDEVSRSVSASSSGHHGLRDRLNGVFHRKIDSVSLMTMGKQWIRNPMNMALFLWMLCVAISYAILFLVMTGMLNAVLPYKSQRDAWLEVNNQVLNALNTLMCLYYNPKRFYHLVLLCRWRPEDISKLRKVYCKNGTYKPHEWAHMMVVVLLLHVSCFAQYALCGLNLGYKRSERSAIGVGICASVGTAASAIACVYNFLSPLGKDYNTEVDEEAQIQLTPDQSRRPDQLRLKSLEKRYSFTFRDEMIVESSPRWSGGILDCWDDISSAYLSLFCSFCVFGWNMERLGFGNMFVHIATFILFCVAPFLIFVLASVNIDNDNVRETLVATGVVLCLFGLLYGGFWRIQMRKRFNLPAYNFCFGQPAASDCTLWLFCCWCSLAQESRTGISYDIIEDKFSRKQMDNGDQPTISPLPREDGVVEYRSGPSSPTGYNSSPAKTFLDNSSSPRGVSNDYYSPERKLSMVKEESPTRGKDETMIPPAPSTMQRESI